MIGSEGYQEQKRGVLLERSIVRCAFVLFEHYSVAEEEFWFSGKRSEELDESKKKKFRRWIWWLE